MVLVSRSFDSQSLLMQHLDSTMKSEMCLHHGDFSSVFYCRKKRSGRKIALKVIRFDDDEDDDGQQNQDDDNTNSKETFERELRAVTKLNAPNNDGKRDPRDVLIICFQECWTCPQMACIIMNACQGGSLADDISRRNNNCNMDPPYYTERRIAWYALQLCDALSFAHERGVAHHDVKSANVLINQSTGGTLVLSDFGGAVAPGEESVAFTKAYASPELLHAHERGEYAGLRADKIDVFGVGCILFELISCQRLRDLDSRGRVLAQVIEEDGINQALHLPCITLPWIPDDQSSGLGYSMTLGLIISKLLDPLPENRGNLPDLALPLRQHPTSPLLRGQVIASKKLRSGDQLSMDNVQLGMFVTTGRDWDDDDEDGGAGCVGVVVKLDGDARFCEVAWPKNLVKGPFQHRIGAQNKFELQVGPTSLPDFVSGTSEPRKSGILPCPNSANNYHVGQQIHDNWVVAHVHESLNFVLVAPLNPSHHPMRFSLPTSTSSPTNLSPAPMRNNEDPPSYWEQPTDEYMQFLPVSAGSQQTEYEKIRQLIVETTDQTRSQIEIDSITRVECKGMWKHFTTHREAIARENWGVSCEKYLFLSSLDNITWYSHAKEYISAVGHDLQQYGAPRSSRTRLDFQEYAKAPQLHRGTVLILSRVSLGRSREASSNMHQGTIPFLSFHSIRGDNAKYDISDFRQVYPEYIIELNLTRRRIVRVRRPETQFFPHNPATSATFNTPPKRIPDSSLGGLKTDENDRLLSPAKVKMCVVCMTNAADRVLIPCGHVCLCGDCSAFGELARLNSKCPECRQNFREVIKIYSQVVEPE